MPEENGKKQKKRTLPREETEGARKKGLWRDEDSILKAVSR
jgi:hypothetical protein